MSHPAPTAPSRNQRKLVVGVGAMAVSNDREVVLATYSLGSCLGVTIYDPISRTGGLLHAMLPDSGLDLAKAAEKPAMFVDTGVSALFRAAYQLCAGKHRVQICLAGGAGFMDDGGFFNIGQRNYARCTGILRQHGLAPRIVRVGGTASRTIFLNLATGDVRLTTTGVGDEIFSCRS